MPIYIIRAGDNGPVKIGKADDVELRRADLQTGHHETLHIIRVIDTADHTEAALHRRFAQHRIRGEWFHFDPEMLTFVPPFASQRAVHQEGTVTDIVERARENTKREVRELRKAIWRSYAGWTTQVEFARHLAELLQCRRSRALNLIRGRVRMIEVHELEGLRALAAKLREEGPQRDPFQIIDQVAEQPDLLKRKRYWAG